MTQRAIDGDFIYFVTANIKDRRWYFVTPERAQPLGQAIQTSCRMKRFDLLAYCILPNHIHLLVRKMPSDETTADRTLGSMRSANDSYLFPHRRLPSRRSTERRTTLSDVMHSIKSAYSQSLRQGTFWQHRSYFRIIDSDEYFFNVIEYIRNNHKKMDLPSLYGTAPFVFVDENKLVEYF